MLLTNFSLRSHPRCLNPHAFNLGANLGKAGGGGIDQHFHFHIVPRWQGDTNFMPIVAETRVLPENSMIYMRGCGRRLSKSQRRNEA